MTRFRIKEGEVVPGRGMSLWPGLEARDGEHGTRRKGSKFSLGVTGATVKSLNVLLRKRVIKCFQTEEGCMWSG